MSHLYAVLGVSRRVDSAGLKSAYRQQAKACHPDLHGGDDRAERRFKEISVAYETLGDPQARAAYDAECAAARIASRRRLWRTATTMSASFVITVGSGLMAAKWLLGV